MEAPIIMHWNVRLPLAAAALCVLAHAQAATPRQLFLDPTFLEESDHVTLRVNPAQQRETVIRADKPWEKLMISFYLTVLDDGGKLRMWYICRDKKNQPNVAYAESPDGISWTKPNLGIVPYEGSTENNLVGMSSLEGTVYRDERASPEERYCYITHLWTEGMVRFFSADGLRWKRDAAPLLNFGADSQAVTFWDERARKYALYLRGWEERLDKRRYRTVVRADLTDLHTPVPIQPNERSRRLWGKDKTAVIDNEFPKVLETDELDPPNTDVYTISAQPYPADSRWYLGFPSFFQREKTTSTGRLDVECIGSSDGFHWHRYDREPYARPGLADSDSANMVFIGPGMIMRGDEIWQYGTGFQSGHGDRAARERRTDGVIFRYVQRLDGFVSADFASTGGHCVTAPVRVTGPCLALNVDTAVLGSLRVSLTDEAKQPIPGFDLDDCEALRINSTNATVTWKGGADLSTLKDQNVRLTFSGSNAKLFSFFFTEAAP